MESSRATEVKNYQGLLSQQRVLFKNQSASLKEAKQNLSKLSTDLKELAVLREIEQERAHASIVEILDIGMANAREEASGVWREKLELEKKVSAEKLSEHKQLNKDLESKLNQAEGNLHRLEGSVADMLTETAEEVSARAATSVAAAEGAIKALQEEIAAAACPPKATNSFLSMCKALLSAEDFSTVMTYDSPDAFGSKAVNIESMLNGTRKRQMATSALMCTSALWEAAFAGKETDTPGLLKAMKDLRFASKFSAGSALLAESESDMSNNPLVQSTAKSYISSMRAKKKVRIVTQCIHGCKGVMTLTFFCVSPFLYLPGPGHLCAISSCDP
jgi:hypothetical protein